MPYTFNRIVVGILLYYILRSIKHHNNDSGGFAPTIERAAQARVQQV